MQALILFAVFGALMAAVAGVISTAVDSTQQFVQNQVEQTRQYFRDAENVLLNLVVPTRMQIPQSNCPDGTIYAATDVRGYLCRTEVAQLASWVGSSAGTVDPWKQDFRGFVVRREVPIYASPPNQFISAPVTAMVLVSAGPDNIIDQQLQTSLNALSANSQIRDVLRIAARDRSNCSPTATLSCDDIVYSFSDQGAQMKRLQQVEGAVNRIASAALRNYNIQFLQFLPQLKQFYASTTLNLYNPDGSLNLNNTILNAWKSENNAPSFNEPDLSVASERARLGVDEEFRYLTGALPQGSGLNVNFTVSSSSVGVNDILVIDVRNSSSPWGQWESGSGALNYRKQAEAMTSN